MGGRRPIERRATRPEQERPVAHWIAAAGLSLYVVAGLNVLTARSRLANRGALRTAWAVLTVAALWTLTTAIAEATAVTRTAISGNADLFALWWSFAEGNANGFAILALAVAVIARDDARRSDRVTPAWAAHTGSLAGILAFTSWGFGMWFGVAIGNPVWVAASILMSLWTLWFGIGLVRGGGLEERGRLNLPGPGPPGAGRSAARGMSQILLWASLPLPERSL